mmetsp:Transcript_38417/g.119460  ORF Transcript_38417/g.119460 Transcript_38417/m.119460 type:complete len:248 (+) Transcript_38417:152-895(+)
MPMATLLDRPLWPECQKALRQLLYPIVERFRSALPASVDFWRDGSYQRLVLDFGVGNFGSVGGRYLYSKLGVSWPDEAFLRRAEAQLPRVGRMMADTYRADGADFLRQRVLTYAEFEFTAPGLKATLRGKGTHENGRTAGSRWLVPVRPPFCPYADRGTCSEFRMLSGLCEAVARADPRGACDAEARARFAGLLRVLVSGPCCISCVGAFAQFRLLFPGIEVQLAAGRMPRSLKRQDPGPLACGLAL